MSKIVTPLSSTPKLKTAIDQWVQAKYGFDPKYNPELQSIINEFGLPWFRVAALVVDADGKILMMHEAKVQVKKIKSRTLQNHYLTEEHRDKKDWVNEDGGWNIPAGRVMTGESFEDALVREVKEESDHTIKILGLLYIRWGKDYAMPTYLVQDLAGPEEYQTEETLGIGKFSVEGIRALRTAGILRSPESVVDSLSVYESYLNGERQLNQINPYSEVA